MTALAQSAVVAAFISTLTAAAPLVGVPVYRTRMRPLQEGQSQAVVVRKANSLPQGGEILGHPIDWTTAVQVECYARGTPTQASDEACDALLLLVNDALNVDQSLGGVIDYLEDPSLAWDEDEKDNTIGCAVATYRVLHRTAHRSLGV